VDGLRSPPTRSPSDCSETSTSPFGLGIGRFTPSSLLTDNPQDWLHGVCPTSRTSISRTAIAVDSQAIPLRNGFARCRGRGPSADRVAALHHPEGDPVGGPGCYACLMTRNPPGTRRRKHYGGSGQRGVRECAFHDEHAGQFGPAQPGSRPVNGRAIPLNESIPERILLSLIGQGQPVARSSAKLASRLSASVKLASPSSRRSNYLAGLRPVNATSRSNALASAGTPTGGWNPSFVRPAGVMMLRANPSTYSASESGTSTSRPMATA